LRGIILKSENIKEITIVIIIIVLSITGILRLNEIINYQIDVTTINRNIVSQNFDEAEKNIKSSNLKVKDIDLLKEKVRKGKEIENAK
jgi:hypothetical protein